MIFFKQNKKVLLKPFMILYKGLKNIFFDISYCYLRGKNKAYFLGIDLCVIGFGH